MINFPIAKINLGLNVVSKRTDGYHDLETVFYPVAITDALEVYPMDEAFPSDVDCDLKITNAAIDCHEQDNLVVKAYRQLAAIYPMSRVHAHLFKAIPSQAGMGGGSSDCAYMIKALAELFQLPMTENDMLLHASKLGADCAFFIKSCPCYAEGIGEKLLPINLSLKGLFLVVVCPGIPVSTREAFSLIKPKPTVKKCSEIVMQPIETWRDELTNDFEKSVFALHPEIGEIKEELYRRGAVYAAMSGSGSSVFGLFRKATDLEGVFPGMFYKQIDL
ncbi:MAG: 4-(cytidine 5'-diphospho)-2-C-methyl-D-erythritol kinase [Prevotella sp.]